MASRASTIAHTVLKTLVVSALVSMAVFRVMAQDSVLSDETRSHLSVPSSAGSGGAAILAPAASVNWIRRVDTTPLKEFVITPATGNPFAIRSTEMIATPKKQISGPEWQFSFAPYLYMTGVTGKVGARGRVADIDLDFTDVIEHLNLGLMGAFEARRGRFTVSNDLIWIKLGEERDTPRELYSSIKLGVNMVVWDPKVGYRVYNGERGSFDMVGGLRLMSVETNLNFRAGILPATDVSERKTWATPVIGGHGMVDLTRRFFLSTRFDMGGGVGADFTGQFYGGAGYRVWKRIALVGGYRYLRTNYDSDAGFLFDTTMNGIVAGAKFSL